MFPDKYQEWCIRYGQKGCKFYEICSLFVVKDGFENSEIRLQSLYRKLFIFLYVLKFAFRIFLIKGNYT